MNKNIYVSNHARSRYIERVMQGNLATKRDIDKEILAYAKVHPEKCVMHKKGENSWVIATILTD